MNNTILYIKHMVCPRCIMAVRSILQDNGISPLRVELGYAVLPAMPSADTLDKIRNDLEAIGFQLIDDPRARLVEQVKTAIIRLVHYDDIPPRLNLSAYLSGHLHHDYSALSKLFTQATGTTIEKYYIAQRVERVKQLLVDGDLTVSQIADLLHYSSVAHLSAQFRAVTGITPTAFRHQANPRLHSLDQLENM